MTAMDIWMFICMIFVALTKFEYAMQLKIRFGTVSKISTPADKRSMTKTVENSRKIDRIALIIFFVVYIMTVVGYFYTLNRRA